MEQNKMNRSDLEKHISKKTNLSKEMVRTVLDEFTQAVVDTLKAGGTLTLTGLGRFEMRKRNPKNYTNPRTKQFQVLDAKMTPGLKFSTTIKGELK